MTDTWERCSLCGNRVPLGAVNGDSARETCCRCCHASKRTRDLGAILMAVLTGSGDGILSERLGEIEGRTVYETQSRGPLHDLLCRLPGYVCSEYFDGVDPGAEGPGGVRCESLEALTFDDNSFDMVISQDVFEHVDDPWQGFREVHRVLKPGGVHVFTIPFHEGHKTQSRKGLPEVFHGDPLRQSGSLVVTDFGEDLPDLLARQGIPTRIHCHERFYPMEAVPYIDNDAEHARYCASRDQKSILKYFLYNSVVLVSRKESGESNGRPDWTGERYLPWIEGSELHYEHLHRYAFAASLASGKRVLDLASGEGYGSAGLAEKACYVLGVDIDAHVVAHARRTYGRTGLDFCAGSLLDFPLKAGKGFDMAVCFEAIEHIEQHDRFLVQVKQQLKPGGLFIVSTPNKLMSQDAAPVKNPFHVKELYLDEFVALLKMRFANVTVLGQAVCAASRIYPLDDAAESVADDRCIRKGAQGFAPDTRGGMTPDYYVAVASDGQLPDCVALSSSHMIDNSRVLLTHLKEGVAFLSGQFHEKEKIEADLHRVETELAAVLGSRAWRLAERVRSWIYRRH
ncbi:MAG: methyltransferase domain-containing protein [Pseudomonadota bacterium]